MTVLELMIVLVILSLIGTIAGMQIFQQLDRARVDVALLQLRQVQNGLTLFQLDTRQYPASEDGLSALVQNPGERLAGWRGPYLKSSELLLDPWGSPIGYEVAGVDYTLTSLGADGNAGGEGAAADIVLTNDD